MKVKVQWDLSVDDRDEPYTPEEVDVPIVVDVPEDIDDEEDISDWLSDTYGWCHFGWEKV
jgi:hypothetical protein